MGRDCPGGAFLGGPSPQNMAPISSLTLGSLSKPRTSYSLVRSWYFKCRTSDSLTDIQYEVSGLMKKPFFLKTEGGEETMEGDSPGEGEEIAEAAKVFPGLDYTLDY